MADNKNNTPAAQEDGFEYEADIVTLLDENDREVEFEVIDTIYLGEVEYDALVPHVNSAEEIVEADCHIIFMRVEEEDGERYFDEVLDDDELERVNVEFRKHLKDTYDINDRDIDTY